jgi:hypothetical protein
MFTLYSSNDLLRALVQWKGCWFERSERVAVNAFVISDGVLLLVEDGLKARQRVTGESQLFSDSPSERPSECIHGASNKFLEAISKAEELGKRIREVSNRSTENRRIQKFVYYQHFAEMSVYKSPT